MRDPPRTRTMKRNMQKAIDDYNALIKKKGGNFGAFYASDVEELKKITTDESGINFWEVVLEALWNGLRAGFMIGYRAGLREASRRNRGELI